MVARLFRLRVALLAAPFRETFTRSVGAVIAFAALFAAAILVATLPPRLSASAEQLATFDTAVGAVILGAVVLVPFFANRGHLEPRQFAGFPMSSSQVALGLLGSTIVSWPFLLLLSWVVALGVSRPAWHAHPVALCLTLLGVLVLGVCGARVASALSKLVIGSDRAGVVRATGAVLLVAFAPVAVFIAATTFGESDGAFVDVTSALSWTPFGAPFAALWQMAAADDSGLAARFAIMGGFALLCLIVWFPLVKASNERVERPSDTAVARRGLGWFERFPARPASVISARTLTYWARDPRYRVALIAIPIAPIVMLLAFWVAGAGITVLALLPLPVMLLLLGWSLHNDVAMDSTAIWSHVASGIKGREDRAGRLAPVLVVGVPLAVIGSSLTVTVLGEWRILPAVIGLNLGVLFVAAGVASVFSVLMPYPTTRPGDSPFLQPQWSGSGSGRAQTMSIIVAILLSLPPVWFALHAVFDVEFAANLWALLFGVGYGALVLLAGVLIGGAVFNRSAPELIAVTQVYD